MVFFLNLGAVQKQHGQLCCSWTAPNAIWLPKMAMLFYDNDLALLLKEK